MTEYNCAFEELCDQCMSSYEQSTERRKKSEQILDEIENLKKSLEPDLKARLIRLLDRINENDSESIYEAFKSGMVFMTMFYNIEQ